MALAAAARRPALRSWDRVFAVPPAPRSSARSRGNSMMGHHQPEETLLSGACLGDQRPRMRSYRGCLVAPAALSGGRIKVHLWSERCGVRARIIVGNDMVLCPKHRNGKASRDMPPPDFVRRRARPSAENCACGLASTHEGLATGRDRRQVRKRLVRIRQT